MHVVRDPAHTITLAPRVSGDGGEIRMKSGSNPIAKAGNTFLRAEDDMDDDQAE
jgi:hypothetical protein